MKCPITLTLIVLFCFYKTTTAQLPPYKYWLPRTYKYKLHVNKNEQLLIATRGSGVIMTDSLKGYWKSYDMDKYQQPRYSGSINIHDICYYNKDSALLIGEITDYGGRTSSYLFNTIDAGKTWNKIDFTVDSSVHRDFNMERGVNRIACLDNGEAWIAVPFQGLAHTKDGGFTWTPMLLPLPKNEQSFTALYFNEQQQGLLGWKRNKLTYTANNGESWTAIPTPFDQKKYVKTNVYETPQINRIAIYKDYLLVRQEELLFYSKKDSIHWIALPDYADFYTDTENSALFFKTYKNGIVSCKDPLTPIASYTIHRPIDDAVCKNASLFIATETHTFKIAANSPLAAAPIFIDSVKSIKPKYLGYLDDNRVYAAGNKIYIDRPDNKTKEYYDQWEYSFSLPFTTDSGDLQFLNDSTLLLIQPNDSLIFYNIPNNQVTKTTRKKVFEAFCNTGIKQLTFTMGYLGCVLSKDKIVYVRRNGLFVIQQMDKTDWRKMPRAPGSIPVPVVTDFLQKLPAIYNKQARIENIGFTEMDYARCKEGMQHYKETTDVLTKEGAMITKPDKGFYLLKNNIDFNQLIALADSVRTLAPSILNNNLNGLSHKYSYWIDIEFKNRQDQVLDIVCFDHADKNSFFPWSLSLNGIINTNTAIEINQFINKIYPGFLVKKDNEALLYELVKDLYLAQ